MPSSGGGAGSGVGNYPLTAITLANNDNIVLVADTVGTLTMLDLRQSKHNHI
jgi:hypothetical protein